MEETWNAMEERRSRPGGSFTKFVLGEYRWREVVFASNKIRDLLLQPNHVVIK
jgi:hypothetical protein